MLKNIYTLIPVLFFAGSTIVQASEKPVYKKYNSDGVVEFSDQPSKKSKPIHVPHMNTYKQKPFPKKAREAKDVKKQKSVTSYSQLSITSPSNDAFVRENSGRVTVNLKVNPGLNPADSIKVVLDGNAQSAITGKSTSLSFINLAPGPHKLQAFIINSEGAVLIQSTTVAFFLKRFSIRPPASP
ncbi:hypothetical protein MNBD_GAMMA23-2405 [hydrothermal vent metagenome]|uniref:DUF4124 domain-containing protein n=1 Tax=hydrothermal vent metagenome TaxID=652676 RepID=A0A3B0ZYP6_9ZZZZ